MPTDRTLAPWASLADTAVTRLRSAIAKDEWFDATDLETVRDDARSAEGLAFKMARATARLDPPNHLPEEQIAAIRRAGGDPHRTDAEGRDRPKVRIPNDTLLLTIRLAATLGTFTQKDKALAEGAVTVIETDRPIGAELFQRVLRALLPVGWRIATGFEAGDGIAIDVHVMPTDDELKATVERSRRDLMKALSSALPILIVTDNIAAFPDAVRRGCDVLRLARPNADIILTALSASHSATGAIDGIPVRAALPTDAHLARIDDTALLLAFRASSPVEVAHRIAATTGPRAGDGPTLADIAGGGKAEAQARRMVRDLQAWQSGEVAWYDVERSVIFNGAPGTGKSYLARAMAGEAGVSLVRGSLAAWQACGHLGDMLRAMRDSFAEARRSAPAVFIIDEIDAIGSRSDGDRHGQRYHRQVINAFLQELDALGEMEGVLVVGTCNDLTAIDPAVLRPGRFDAHVRVPVPGRAAVSGMLRAAFPDTDGGELAPAIRAATGLTAAEIDGAIRAARSAARDAGTGAPHKHLLAALSDRVYPPDIARRIALHESGHAVIAFALDLGMIERIALTPGGGEIELARHKVSGLLSELEDHLVYDLGGRAAETLVLGTPSAGAGGPDNSDLAQATARARNIELTSGLGLSGLAWNGAVSDLDAAIRDRLQNAEARATDILTAHKADLLRIANKLMEHGVLEREEVEDLVATAWVPAERSRTVGQDCPEHARVLREGA
ncbi:ATP-dependent zinc metalloprotease FtsH [Rhodobacteraceae bacterium THAF1]|uniref:AAA family ATPase n=1 Tax=Palleronia sp. THAF1 TaxID=2587842 RepID=UPI000F40A60B|nr:AAA family ATPase [Palleronia sp. THAF1]QFU08812.1 ATP-dependent zinc metalloprotease FtsH [Palleronia sp. THAF1]VDC23947.1 ATP-dependent zinc metalloprotease FtsH [Rhodobacteraceae bacterium THAF1]